MLVHFVVFTLLFHNVLYADAQALCRASDEITPEEECGTLSVSLTSSAGGGGAALRQEMPWQAGVYSKGKSYAPLCGGTLVSARVVISAAHCFWGDLEKQLPASLFAVAVGKLYRPWDHPMDENAQKSDVREIRIPPRYHGSITNFQDDLALLVTTSPFVLNAYVKPICLSFDRSLDRKQLTNGNIGKVVGWGRADEDAKPSPSLQVVNLRYVDVERCYNAIEPVFRPAITSDKICAGNTTGGTTVCTGDNGGGLFFPENGTDGSYRYYLRGVVSTAPKSVKENLCNIYTYATFTHVVKHEHFIKEVMLATSSESEEITGQSPINGVKFPPQSISEKLSLPVPKPSRAQEFMTGGKAKPLSKNQEGLSGVLKFETKSDKEIQDPSITQSGRPQSDPDADAEHTVKTIKEPFITGPPAVPSRPEDDLDVDAVVHKPLKKGPTAVLPRPKNDSAADADYTFKIENEPLINGPPLVSSRPQNDPNDKADTVKIVEKSINTGPPIVSSRPQNGPDADADYTVKIVDEPLKNGPTASRPQNDHGAHTDYTVKIVEKPEHSGSQVDTIADKEYTDKIKGKLFGTESLTKPSRPKTDSNADGTVKIKEESSNTEVKAIEISSEKRPFLSTASKPYLSAGNQSTSAILNQPILSIKNQPDQPIRNQTPLSTGIQQSQISGNQSTETEENQPILSIWNQPGQPTGNQLLLSRGKQPQTIVNQSAGTTGSQPITSIWNQPGQPTGNQLLLSTEKPPQTIVNHSTETKGNQPIQSIWNQPGQPTGNQLLLSAGKQPQTIVNQSAGTTGSQPILSIWNQPGLPTGNQLPLSTGKQPQTIVNQSAGTTGSQPIPSIWNQPGQPTGNQLPLSIGKQPQTIVNQSAGTTGSQPILSIWNQPGLPTGNQLPLSTGKQPQTIVNQSVGTTGSQPIPSIWNQPGQPIRNQTPLSTGIQQFQISGIHSTETKGNQPILSIWNQPGQPTENQLPLSTGKQPQTIVNQSAGTGSQPIPSIWNQPGLPAGNQNPLSIENQQPLSTWNPPGQITANQPLSLEKQSQTIANQSAETKENQPTPSIWNQLQAIRNQTAEIKTNQPISSIWNQPGHSTGNQLPPSTGNQPQTIENQSAGGIETQPILSIWHQQESLGSQLPVLSTWNQQPLPSTTEEYQYQPAGTVEIQPTVPSVEYQYIVPPTSNDPSQTTENQPIVIGYHPVKYSPNHIHLSSGNQLPVTEYQSTDVGNHPILSVQIVPQPENPAETIRINPTQTIGNQYHQHQLPLAAGCESTGTVGNQPTSTINHQLPQSTGITPAKQPSQTVGYQNQQQKLFKNKWQSQFNPQFNHRHYYNQHHHQFPHYNQHHNSWHHHW